MLRRSAVWYTKTTFMKAQTLILGIVAVIVVIFGIWFLFMRGNAGTTGPAGTNLENAGGQSPLTSSSVSQTTVATSTTSSSQGALTVTARDGGTVSVNDFKNDPTVVAAPSGNQGYYYLTGWLDPKHPARTYPYSIFYVDADQSFNITLQQEPIKQTRQQAEQELLQRLGIGQQGACRLNYWVGVPYGVNPIYSGKNLGFSFCPGAVQLP